MEVFVRHGFEDLLVTVGLGRFLPRGGRPAEKTTVGARAAHLRQAFEELGPTFIKLGQYLSIRPDITPISFVEELARVRDLGPAVEPARLKGQVERELGRPFDELFEHFDGEPIVSTSLTQVHRARLRSNGSLPDVQEVTVKLIRPGVEESVEIDLALFEELAGSLQETSLGQRYPLASFASELRAAMRAELDLSREAGDSERLRESLSAYEYLRVPRPLPELCGPRIFVAEHIHGVSLSDSLGKERRRRLADELWRAYLKQILVEGIVHRHVQPDNIVLDDQDRVVIQEPGSVRYLSRETRLRLMVLLLALLERDGERAAAACVEIGYPGSKLKERDFAREVGRVVARYSGPGVGELALELAATAFRHDVQIPPEMIILGKTLSGLESLCFRLEPETAPAATMREVVSSLLGGEVSRELSTQRMLATAVGLRSFLDEVPSNLRRIIGRASSNELQFGIRLEQDKEMQSVAQKIANRVTIALIIAALIVGSALMLNVDATWRVGGYPLFGLAGFLLAAGFGIYFVGKTLSRDK
jgi:predicted unusual protein kinase regulating ubiquinone biosynthesis (AarF/ABC1/UbiB family)